MIWDAIVIIVVRRISEHLLFAGVLGVKKIEAFVDPKRRRNLVVPVPILKREQLGFAAGTHGDIHVDFVVAHRIGRPRSPAPELGILIIFSATSANFRLVIGLQRAILGHGVQRRRLCTGLLRVRDAIAI
jgi:hypothetical protein